MYTHISHIYVPVLLIKKVYFKITFIIQEAVNTRFRRKTVNRPIECLFYNFYINIFISLLMYRAYRPRCICTEFPIFCLYFIHIDIVYES